MTNHIHSRSLASELPRPRLCAGWDLTRVLRDAIGLQGTASDLVAHSNAQHRGRRRAGVDDAAVGHLVRLQASLAQPLLRPLRIALLRARVDDAASRTTPAISTPSTL